jgi:hypothetical protein
MKAKIVFLALIVVVATAIGCSPVQPTLTAMPLPSTLIGPGAKALYHFSIAASGNTGISWKIITFQLTGSINVGGPVQMWVGATESADDGVYLTDARRNRVRLIDQKSMKVYDLATNTIVPGEYYITHTLGVAYVVFVATNEQVVATGTTTIYEFRGDIAYGGYPGDWLMIKIPSLAKKATTDRLDVVSRTGPVAFVWSNRSAVNHNDNTSDWSNEYGLSEFPLATLGLTR